MMPAPGEALTIAQAMAVVHVSRRTIYNWIAEGRVTVLRTPSGRPRILAASLWREPETKGASDG